MFSVMAYLMHMWKGNKKTEKESEPKVDVERPKFVQMIRQNGLKILDFSSQYSSNGSRSYAACNIAGSPSSFPSYGDFVKSFVLRTYGQWWQNAPSAPSRFKRISKSAQNIESIDFVDILFDVPVIPKVIHILETYNPGSIIKIFALQTNDYQEEPIITNNGGSLLRFEFNHEHLDYYTEIDAVELMGNVVNNVEDESQEHQDDTSLNADMTTKLMKQLSLNDDGRSGEEDTEVYSNNGFFDLLPSEVIHLIFLYLQFDDILRVAATCRLFFRHCYDPVWYKELDLQPYWSMTSDVTLEGLRNRCGNTEKLNLSWCGPYCAVSSLVFMQFLETSCQKLVCLRLSACKFVDNDAVRSIAKSCPQLQELDLSSCMYATNEGFLHLKVLQNLTRLNFYRVNITDATLLEILWSSSGLKHLNIGACSLVNRCDDVLSCLRENCRDLISLDLWRNISLTSEGISRLAEGCPLLEELEIGWCSSVVSSTECIQDFIKTHPRLKKLFMAALRSIDSKDVLAIAEYCKDMEQLDILGTSLVGPETIRRLMTKCSKLKFLDVSFCSQLKNGFVQEIRNMYPKTSIKKSFTTDQED
ncbi:hypothetical protein QZH41_012454 [Actinostola sp. cb2023]|nr:hypothetical protein QZH41_012454 [Actinostola sp. cb2023]